VNACDALYGANAGTLSQRTDDGDLLVEIEDVCHVINVIHKLSIVKGFCDTVFRTVQRGSLKILGVVGGLCIVAAIVFVAYRQHCAAEEYKRHRAEYCAWLGSQSAEKEKTCTQKGDSPSNYLPWGYELFTWPEGITTWAIIGTGLVIAWQSFETRKAAEIAKKALILEFRPKIIVRSVKLIEIDGGADGVPDWKVEIALSNTGGTDAHVIPFTVSGEWYDRDRERRIADIGKIGNEGFTLAGGEPKLIQIQFAERGFNISMYTLRVSIQGFGKKQYRFPVVYGTIAYRDDLGTTRRTGFRRAWDAKDEVFRPAADPEYEYQD